MKTIISLSHWDSLVKDGIKESELMNGGAKVIPISCPDEKCNAKLWDMPDDEENLIDRNIVCMVCGFQGTRKKGK